MERCRRSAAALGTVLPVALSLSLFASTPTPVQGQLATVTVEENLRLEPNGIVLARILPGTTLAVEGREERWVEATLEGWVWARSLQATDRAGFDLTVSATEGENLRGRPQGAVLARLESGTLLHELERTTGWIRVRRTAWIWTESVRLDEAGPEAASPTESLGEGAPTAAPEASAPPSAETVVLTAPAAGSAVLASPGGDTLALVRPGADVQVLERRGGWSRVRVEGWTWSPSAGRSDAAPSTDDDASSQSAGAATPSDVQADPDRWIGRVVTWDLQFVSLERAERVRTDFFESEPFMLTRIPGGRGPFVYVAVPSERVAEIEGLTPLERIRVTGRVRVGSSALTGSPILDLVEYRRTGR